MLSKTTQYLRLGTVLALISFLCLAGCEKKKDEEDKSVTLKIEHTDQGAKVSIDTPDDQKKQ